MKELTYEQAYKRLEEIVEKLENGSVPLEESMKLFEEGTKLANFCNSKLNAAEQKFTQLITENSESDNNE
ncbi:MAG: exodeoxyribonuclease VII small subunit [Ruminococcus sp.]|jgi:exodeoxyribonuclease VII small subunit|nr:exodeoxyribonuclease VII small subunit [Oscillospiraceae bacterium]MDD6271846.1 exodeoxyribonuclease VII small subunit [Ruminococcus sp.]MDD7345327.1 exodeoxyribonuclease VII small subunit [Ruminococcus sp.]MDY6059436.1 exodeoxyribonuclease VII small subunit [Candidatus Fimenecus sp.]